MSYQHSFWRRCLKFLLLSLLLGQSVCAYANVAIAISGAGANVEVSGINYTYTVTANGSYNYNISNFHSGDQIIGVAGSAVNLVNAGVPVADGTYQASLQFTTAAVQDTVTLIGLTQARDAALFSVNSLNTVFGAGTYSNGPAAQQTSQTIGTVAFSPSALATGGTTTASATASSGLAVSFSSTTPAVCSVSGSTVTGIAVGTCTIAANQAGNTTYSAAAQVTQSIQVTQPMSSQTIGAITFSPSTLAAGGNTTVSATATSGLAVSFSSLTPAVCSMSSSTVTGIAAGTCTIAADQSGNANYSAATQVTQSITIGTFDAYSSTGNQLTIPKAVVRNVYVGNTILGNITYTNVVVTLGNVISVGAAPAVGTFDTFDGTYLTIPTVSAYGTTYYNVKATIGNVISVGGGVWSPLQ